MGDHPQDRGARRLTEDTFPTGDDGRDTIAAIATARGRAGIGVVRISGKETRRIAERVLGRVPRARHALLCDFLGPDGKPVDRGIALYFRAPASYTGEDVLELQGHGGVEVMDTLLECVLAAGARLAAPGEFTRRAFLCGRIDLAQAEAVADLIEATSEQAVRAAQATLRGEFSRRVHELVEALTQVRLVLEAGFDFADEGIEPIGRADLRGDLAALREQLEDVLRAARRGVRLGHGLRTVLAGAPNVGKSSVFNRLAGEQRAIVTPVPGTTRDALRETLSLAGASIEVVDTAGLRDSADPVEQMGIERAREQLAHCDLVLLVVDDRAPGDPGAFGLGGGAPVVTVHNKIDLSGARPGFEGDRIRVSALTGAGFDALITLLGERAAALTGEGAFTARERHVESLHEALSGLERAARCVDDGAGLELVAEDLRLVQDALGRITGQVHSDDLLGRIFASFCIGK